MHKIQLTAIEKKLINDSLKTSSLLITIFSILQLRNAPVNGGSTRDFEMLNIELKDLAPYVEALQKSENPAPAKSFIVDQVQDMTYRIQLPSKVEQLFQRTGFDTTIEFHTDSDYDDQGANLLDRFESFKILAGIDIRVINEESPR